MARYDVVVVGAGHNGLIAAAILARHGLNVAVVEKNTFPGGLAGGIPGGLPSSMFAYAVGLLPPELARHLGLSLEEALHRPDPSWVEYEPGGAPLLRWWRDPERLTREAREAGLEGLPHLLEDARVFWRCYKAAGLYYTVKPPSPEEAAQALDGCPGDPGVFVEEPSSRILSRYLPRDRWDLVLYPSMYEALGFALAYYLQSGGVWDLPRGGMAGFASRLARIAEAEGVRVFYGCRVERVLFENGRAVGVEACGRRFEARALLYAGPIQGLLRLGGVPERLEEREVRALREASRRISRVTRVDYLLAGPPDPPREEPWKGYPIIVSWDERGGGDYSYPSLYDGPLPGGLHLVQASGYPGTPERGRLPPGVDEDLVVAWWERGPGAQEYCCGNPTGYPDHLPMREPYIMDTRPLPGWGPYTTSIEGLYHGSASSYPGGEVNGVAGHNAAARILVDLGVEPRYTLLRLAARR